VRESRFSEEQKIGILRQVRAGSTVKAVCAHNIGVQADRGWEGEYGTMEVNEARPLQALEEECGRLRRPVTEFSAQKSDPEGSERKNWRRKRLRLVISFLKDQL
jgi:phage tail tape-measure protein